MIRRTNAVIAVTAALTMLLSVASLAKEKTPGGSFLRYRANTVAELKQQVANDPVVQSRYASHFGVSSADVKKIVANGVKLVSLERATNVDMWYVGSGGRVFHKVKLLPKGSQVFATSNGELFLAWSCGNPLRSKLPKQRLMPAQEESVKTKVLGAPVEVISSAAIAAPPSLITETAPMLAAIAPVESPSLGVAMAPAVGSLAPQTISSGGSLYNLGWLAGLGALASIRSEDTVVPEPSSILTLALGSGSVLLLGAKSMVRRRK